MLIRNKMAVNINDYQKNFTKNKGGDKMKADFNTNRVKALQDPETNIMYAAAYLKYIQDVWKQAYPEIDGRTAILSTLFNIGVYGKKGIHSVPQPNDFGRFARNNYFHINRLLGI